MLFIYFAVMKSDIRMPLLLPSTWGDLPSCFYISTENQPVKLVSSKQFVVVLFKRPRVYWDKWFGHRRSRSAIGRPIARWPQYSLV
ncbi:unnamed protein product [Prunus armeniaca]|uniref:Uncharacterized protein n=1 Tax=Prunus armeniaca TaxID=36596 RepID=A0A6J5TYC5_PRUAR|nr:unnamed protein product [Prunus armeniaca]